MADITEHERQRLVSISAICADFNADKFQELAGLAYHDPYMEVERKTLEAAFERFQKLKRQREKQSAWERVTDQVFRLKTIADSAIFCSSKTD